MKVCKYCDSPVEDGALQCPGCGARDFDTICARCGTRFDGPDCPCCGLSADAAQHVCPNCGARYFGEACTDCGYSPLRSAATPSYGYYDAGPVQSAASPKSRLVALILAFFFGIFGVHRFYVGKIGSGLLYFVTFSFFGIGWFVDMVLILTGTFRDKNGLQLKNW